MLAQEQMESNGILNSAIDIDGATLQIQVKGIEVRFRPSEEWVWSGWMRVDEALKAMREDVKFRLEMGLQTHKTLQQLEALASEPALSE